MAVDPQKDALGNRQSDYAGTNPDKYGDPKRANDQDHPVQDEEAQNVTEGAERMTHDEAAHDRNKNSQGARGTAGE